VRSKAMVSVTLDDKKCLRINGVSVLGPKNTVDNNKASDAYWFHH